MKKIVLILTGLILGALGHAAPAGNPASPLLIKDGFLISPVSWIDFRIGYEGNFVSDAKLKQRAGATHSIDKYGLDVNSCVATINIQNRLDLFGTAGSSRIQADWRIYPGETYKMECETKYRLIWSAGGTVTLFEWGNAFLGFGGRYLYTRPRLEWLTRNGVAYAPGKAKMRYKEWQIDLSLAYKIDVLTPYLAVKYSRKKATLGEVLSTHITTDDTGILRMKNRIPVGVALGCTITTRKYFMLNIEARLIDEEAATLSGEFRF